MQYQTPPFATPAEAVQQPSVFANYDSELPLDAYDDLFLASSGFDQTAFPGWIITSFDEHKWWAELGPERTSFEAQSQ